MPRSVLRGTRARCAAAAVGGLLAAVACSAPGTAARWQASSPPRLTGVPTARLTGPVRSLPSFADAAFPARAAGWLLATAEPGTARARPEVWHTGTAGATWQAQWRGKGKALSISATDREHAWALIGCSALPRKRPCRNDLIATANTGSTWRLIARLPSTVTQVRFVSAGLGVAAADKCGAYTTSLRCPGHVLVSHDGGSRWAPVLASAGPVFATAAADGRLWAAEALLGAGGKFGLPAPEVRFVTSNDGGRSWQPLGQLSGFGPLTASVQIRLAVGPAGLAWASVFDPQSCAMHGCGTAQLYHSRDGGHGWAIADLAGPRGSQCGHNGIVFSAAPDGTVWASSGQNGGACAPPFGLLYRYGRVGWQPLRPWQLTGISSLAAIGRDVAYALGANVLARTDDGGRHWAQLLPAPAPAGQVDALTASTAFAAQDASDAGAILRTTDGGQHWREVADLPGIVTRLDFPAASDGVAVTFQLGSKPVWRLWRTRNGGLTWDLAAGLPSRITSGDTGVYGPWMAADGRGVLLTLADAIAWEQTSGGTGPVRAWTTRDWGAHWTPGRLLRIGGGILGAASFAPAGPGRWAGWLIHSTARGGWRIESTADTGRSLAPLPGSPDVGAVQLVGPVTGFAWGIQAAGHNWVPVMSLYQTRDNGRHWQHFRISLPRSSFSSPLLAFTDIGHGWLVIGAATWHTSDGGLTWHRGQA